MYYRIYSAIQSQIDSENDCREEELRDSDCPNAESFLNISWRWDSTDFISKVDSDDICYCPCLDCSTEQYQLQFDDNDELYRKWYANSDVDIKIMITNGAVRCYLYFTDVDNIAFIKKLQYHLNLEVIYSDDYGVVFRPRNEDYWILDNLKGLDEKSFFGRIVDITSKIFVIGEQIYEFTKKERSFDE